MSDVRQSAAAEQHTPAEHDHAWRLVPTGKGDPKYGARKEYRCDLCPAIWFT